MVAAVEEMKWAITGGSGQLAKSLSELLTSKHIEFAAWGHKEVDISKIGSMRVIEDYQPDVLINCAAWTDVEGAEESFREAVNVNRDGAENVATTAKILNIPLIHISTDYVFSGKSSTPWNVDDPTTPESNYGLSKLLGERKIEEIWPEKSCILRTAWLYGPHGKNFAKTILRKSLLSEEPIRVVNDQMGQPTSTVDLAARIFDMVDSKVSSGLYHATSSGEATWWDFAREIIRLNQEDISRIIPVASRDFKSKVNRPEYSVLDHSSWNAVGFKPMREWRSALEHVFPAIKANVMKELSND